MRFLFGLMSLFNDIWTFLCFLCQRKVVVKFKEETTFHLCISPKVSALVWQDFEHPYYLVTAQKVNHKSMGIFQGFFLNIKPCLLNYFDH